VPGHQPVEGRTFSSFPDVRRPHPVTAPGASRAAPGREPASRGRCAPSRGAPTNHPDGVRRRFPKHPRGHLRVVVLGSSPVAPRGEAPGPLEVPRHRERCAIPEELPRTFCSGTAKPSRDDTTGGLALTERPSCAGVVGIAPEASRAAGTVRSIVITTPLSRRSLFNLSVTPRASRLLRRARASQRGAPLRAHPRGRGWRGRFNEGWPTSRPFSAVESVSSCAGCPTPLTCSSMGFLIPLRGLSDGGAASPSARRPTGRLRVQPCDPPTAAPVQSAFVETTFRSDPESVPASIRLTA
jgi:hypothetical protein